MVNKLKIRFILFNVTVSLINKYFAEEAVIFSFAHLCPSAVANV